MMKCWSSKPYKCIVNASHLSCISRYLLDYPLSGDNFLSDAPIILMQGVHGATGSILVLKWFSPMLDFVKVFISFSQ